MNMQPHTAGIRSSLLGVVVNIILAIFKGTAGYIGNSYALIADAIESLSDVLSSLIVAAGLRVASIPQDEDHPYGHGKAEPIAAVLVGFGLIAAALTIIVQAAYHIVTPHPTPAPFTLIVLVVVILVKEALFRFVFHVGNTISSTAVRTDAWHHRSDAITSTAVFLGISIALVGGEGYESADDWAALAASVVIFINAYRLLRPAVGEVMDAAPPGELTDSVIQSAASVPRVRKVEKCIVRKVGLSYFVDIHIWVNGTLSVDRGHDIASNVRKAIKNANDRIADVLVHIEPDKRIPQLPPG